MHIFIVDDDPSFGRSLKRMLKARAFKADHFESAQAFIQAKWLEPMVPDMLHRGRLQEGAIADITIFDAETVKDNADWKEGMNSLPSTGIPYVIVNGAVVVKSSKVLKDVFPGQPIRNAVLE